MINWIEATKENIEKYLFENGEFSDEISEGFVFLTEYKDLIFDYCLDYEFGKLNCSCFSDNGWLEITHFALMSEYETILPKETK